MQADGRFIMTDTKQFLREGITLLGTLCFKLAGWACNSLYECIMYRNGFQTDLRFNCLSFSHSFLCFILSNGHV